MIKKIIIYGKNINDMQIPYLKILIEKMLRENLEIFFHNEIMESHPKMKEFNSFPILKTTEDLTENQIDLLISFGGDGTILHSTVLIKNSGIPILGINLGRLS